MGSSNSAQREARRQEAERQARIQEATARIDALFDSPERQKQYGDYVTALRGYYTDDATKQKAVADRNLRFSMARAGLTGGSSAVDANRTLRDDFTRGILEAEQRSQGALADLQSQDQATRLNLIQLANAGTDVTSAAANAAAAMRSNLAGAQASGRVNALGDIFGNTAGIWKAQQEAAERRRGQTAPLGSLYGNPFSR